MEGERERRDDRPRPTAEEEEGTNEEGNGTMEGGRDGRKEGSDEAGWRKQEDCSLMEGGREGETGAAWVGRSRDKLGDIGDCATESGIECLSVAECSSKTGKGGKGEEGGGSVRSSAVVGGSIYKQKEEEAAAFEVEVGKRRRKRVGESGGCDRSVAGNIRRIGKCARQAAPAL